MVVTRRVRVVGAVAALVALAACDGSLRMGPAEGEGANRVRMAEAILAERFGGPATTMELWVKPAGTATAAAPCSADGDVLLAHVALFEGWATTSEDVMTIGLATDGDPWVATRMSTGVATIETVGTPVCADLPGAGLLDGDWHHVALQRSVDGALELWVDGQEVASGTGPAGDSAERTQSSHRATAIVGGPPVVDGKVTSFGGAQRLAVLVDEVRLSTVHRYGPSTSGPPLARFEPDAATAALWHLDGTTSPGPSGTACPLRGWYAPHRCVIDHAPGGASPLALRVVGGDDVIDPASPFD